MVWVAISHLLQRPGLTDDPKRAAYSIVTGMGVDVAKGEDLGRGGNRGGGGLEVSAGGGASFGGEADAVKDGDQADNSGAE